MRLCVAVRADRQFAYAVSSPAKPFSQDQKSSWRNDIVNILLFADDAFDSE